MLTSRAKPDVTRQSRRSRPGKDGLEKNVRWSKDASKSMVAGSKSASRPFDSCCTSRVDTIQARDELKMN
ncbi:MAG: hypothetical protein GYA24_09905 [Candidatus Lokiarchaeota archaeon]|nr:hypothetical protein [Candidatus Lokiarchaeota archaeon]